MINKSKKILSAVLAVIVIFSTFAVTASAASYTTGTFAVASNSGVNVRSGPGTGYSKVGAASKGTTFNVSRVSGSWGYSQSVRCTNGTRSGWIALDYCTKKSTTVYYTLKYNANGGSNAPASVSVKKGEGFTISSQRPTRQNYMFLGWSTNSKDTVARVAPYHSVSLNGNVTLYAVWMYGKAKTNYSNVLSNNGVYTISPACATGSAIDVSGASTSPNANIHLWKKHSGKNQQWKAVYYGSGYYYFVDMNSGLALDVHGGLALDGKNIATWNINKSDSQLFRLISAGNGYYYIQSKLNPAYYVDINGAYSSDGTNVHLYRYNGTSAQKFKFTYLKTAAPASTSVKLNVPLYRQQDSRWANVYIGSRTIGNVGCLITSTAMVYSYKTGTTVYPDKMMKKLRFDNNSLYWSSLSNVGMRYKTYNGSLTNSMMSEIYNLLKSGKPVIIGAITSSGGSEHWVVITGYNGSTSSFSASNFTINDPGYQKCTTLRAFLDNGSYADRTKILKIVY